MTLHLKNNKQNQIAEHHLIDELRVEIEKGWNTRTSGRSIPNVIMNKKLQKKS